MDTYVTDEVNRNAIKDVVRYRWPWIVVSTLAVAAAVGAYVFGLAPSFTSTAKVLLRPITGNALSIDTSRNGPQMTVAMETEAGLVSSPGVAELVSKSVGETVSAASPSVDSYVPVNTLMVAITYTDASGQRAQKMAELYARSFLEFRQAQAKAAIEQRLKTLEGQITTAEAALKKASDAADTETPSPDAVAKVQLYTNRLAGLQDQAATLSAEDTSPGFVVTPAPLGERPTGITPVQYLALGTLLGLALGLALAVWRERNDDRLRRSKPLPSVPFLSLIPSARRGDFGAVDDGYRTLRAVLRATTPNHSAVVVASADRQHDRDQAGAVAANLATIVARSGFRVLLVDATPTGSTLGRLGMTVEPVSVARLAAEDDLSRLVAGLPRRGAVSLLRLGEDGTDSRDVVASQAVRVAWGRLRDAFDYVIVSSPPAATPECSEIALNTDRLILVGVDHRTTRSDVIDVATRADQLNVVVLGLVLLSKESNRSLAILDPEPDAHSGLDAPTPVQVGGDDVTAGASTRPEGAAARSQAHASTE